MDSIALGISGNLQGYMRCFSLLSGRILDRTWKDVDVHKIPQSSISRMKCVVKKQKSVKALKFGDRQNMIDRSISMGVMEDLNDDQELSNYSNLQHNIVTEEPQEVPENDDDSENNADRIIIEIVEQDNKVAVEHRDAEF